MKKLLRVLVLSPFLAFQCASDGAKPECGCKSIMTVKFLESSEATIHKPTPSSPDGYYNIFLDQLEPNAAYFSTLSSCDSLIFMNSDFKDGSRIRITGEIKPICSNPNIKLGSSPVLIKSVELVKGNN